MHEDQELLDYISNKIPYQPVNGILIKPLPIEYVERTVIKQKTIDDAIAYNSKKKKKNEVVDDELPDNFERVIEKGASGTRNGRIIKLPKGTLPPYLSDLKIGDVVSYVSNTALPFELFRDSVIVMPFNIVAIYTDDVQCLMKKKNEVTK